MDDQDQRGDIIVEDEVLREGFTQIPNRVLCDTNLSTGAKIAYATLLSYAWQKESCFPGQATMAQDMGVSEESVNKYLKELVAKEFISAKRRGLGRTNLYTIRSRTQDSQNPKMLGSRTPESWVQEPQNLGTNNTQIKKTQDKKTQYPLNPPENFGRDKTDSDLKRVVPIGGGNGVATLSGIAEREEKDTPLPPSRAAQYIPNWLRAWYAVYPSNRRIPVMEALALFRTAESDPDALLPTTDEQITILRAYCATEGWQKNAGQYVPSMRRYITERMWEHDPDPMSLWRREGNIYPIYIRGRGLTWPPGYKPPEGATQMSRVLNEAGEWISNPMLYG